MHSSKAFFLILIHLRTGELIIEFQFPHIALVNEKKSLTNDPAQVELNFFDLVEKLVISLVDSYRWCIYIWSHKGKPELFRESGNCIFHICLTVLFLHVGIRSADSVSMK